MNFRFLHILTLVFLVAAAPYLFAAPKKKAKMQPQKPIGQKPDIQRVEPRGVQRGIETKVLLKGTNFLDLTQIKASHEKLKIEIDESAGKKDTEVWIKVSPQSDLPRGVYDISAVAGKMESAKVKLYVDDLPQAYEAAMDKMSSSYSLPTPATFWGTLEPAADSDLIEFEAKAGQSLVFDLSAKSIGSKASIMLTLLDAKGNPVGSNNGFDGADPLLFHKVSTSGRYSLRISEEQMGGSADHFYRLTIGELPVVASAFPLSIKASANAEVTLIGFNLPKDSKVRFSAEKTGEMDVPVDLEKFRLRKIIKCLVTDQNEVTESEPNELPNQASTFSVPFTVNGRLYNDIETPSRKKAKSSVTASKEDTDLFRFHAKLGEVIVLETDAARRGSPIDTKIEVLHPDGKPVERVLLQSVRDSVLSFRPIDSFADNPRVENWQEMELNEFMYLQGEVCKIFRMPEGPDSGFQFYKSGGKRITYFDTSATAHALDELCYVVEPHPPGTKLVANGLPTFTLYYANDDDGERELGSDSRLHFTAPRDGDYLARVTDNRGISGERFGYRLTVREAQPDFKVTLGGPNQTVAPGSGQEFNYTLDRIDGFDGDVTMEIANVPEGFRLSTPVVLQAGHLIASGTIFAAANAQAPTKEVLSRMKITATAMVNGKKVVKEINGFNQIKVGEKPTLLVALEPYDEANTNFTARTLSDKPMEITVTPGETTPVWLKVKRDGHNELVTFTVDNLPHGVIVDNIGLNGVLIPKDENERQIFLRCAKWVPETDRIVYCQANQAGRPTSFPVLLHVRKKSSRQTASK